MPGRLLSSAFSLSSFSVLSAQLNGSHTTHAACLRRVHFGSGGADTIASGEPVSQFTFILSAYALNGTWLGFYEWIRDFQLCGIHSVEGGLWRK